MQTAELSILLIQPNVMFVKMGSTELGILPDVMQETFKMSLNHVLQHMLLTLIQTSADQSVLQVSMQMQQQSYVNHVVLPQQEVSPTVLLADMRMEL